MKFLSWLACKIFGHGPYHEGHIGSGEQGHFCVICDKFFTGPAPAKKRKRHETKP